jgi:hypothetical protein
MPERTTYEFSETMSTRRKPASSPRADGQPIPMTSSMPASSIRANASPNTRSPFLPTRLETLLLCIYPATLLFGSVFSALSPSSRNAPYSPTLQSHPPEFAPSYFAKKKNVFNIYFVKVGWFWTTVAFGMFWVFSPTLGASFTSRRRLQALARWGLVTTFWYFVTQWFFGPPLIDRGFRLTGGQCELLRDPAARDDMSKPREYITAATCKAVGGLWRGGYDISGHVFLLILGSSLLWFEFLPALTRAEDLRDGRKIQLKDGKVTSVAVEKDRFTEGEGPPTRGVKTSLSILALMWWMLLMTAAYFHTWFEKYTGLLVAFSGLWVVYFLPRGVPAMREYVGMPGV